MLLADAFTLQRWCGSLASTSPCFTEIMLRRFVKAHSRAGTRQQELKELLQTTSAVHSTVLAESTEIPR
jgi:hypothetical protein